MECILGIFRKYRIVRNLYLNLDTLKINIEKREVEVKQYIVSNNGLESSIKLKTVEQNVRRF